MIGETRTISSGELVAEATALFADGYRLALVAGFDDERGLRVTYSFLAPTNRRVELHVELNERTRHGVSLAGVSFPASRFERELFDLFGIEPVGHPQRRALIRHAHWPESYHPMAKGAGPAPVLHPDEGGYPFISVEGPGVYEIPVGPVHAGLIEPGHFRFSVVGETILKMKARLWFTHKGIERLVEGKSIDEVLVITERISGDSAVAHGLAFTRAVEDALGIAVNHEVESRRAVALELERLYNHVSDLGALANDVGFGLAQAKALTVREGLLRLNERLSGHRLLRGIVTVGGARLLDAPTESELDEIEARVAELTSMTLAQSIVVDRFTGTGVLSHEAVCELGVVGLVARASGLDLDARRDHPIEGVALPATILATSGDVLARYQVRRDEVAASLSLVREATAGTSIYHRASTNGSGAGLGVVEGWRGPVVHRVEIAEGRVTRLKIVDPSFLNWPALAVALADTIVPDFPLVNKSFNLSYAGNDL